MNCSVVSSCFVYHVLFTDTSDVFHAGILGDVSHSWPNANFTVRIFMASLIGMGVPSCIDATNPRSAT